jgi:hypothetical protein
MENMKTRGANKCTNQIRSKLIASTYFLFVADEKTNKFIQTSRPDPIDSHKQINSTLFHPKKLAILIAQAFE